MKPESVVRSTCPYCGVGCQVLLNIKDDTIFRIDAPFDAAPNYGRLCVKGPLWRGLRAPPQPADFAVDPADAAAAGAAHSRRLSRRLARGELGRGAGSRRRPAARPAGALWAGQHHGQRLRQGHQRRQLPVAEVPPPDHRHQQRRPLRPPVPRGQRQRPAAGHRLQRHEQFHRRDGTPGMLHGHRLQHRRDPPGDRDLSQAGRAQKRRQADRGRPAPDRDDPLCRPVAA